MRRLTRRGFIGSLAAGFAALRMPRSLPWLPSKQTIVTFSGESVQGAALGVLARNIYRSNGDGVYKLIATIENNEVTSYTDIQEGVTLTGL